MLEKPGRHLPPRQNPQDRPAPPSRSSPPTPQLDLPHRSTHTLKTDKFTGAVIIAVHHPPYAFGTKSGSLTMLKEIDAICDSIGVWPHAFPQRPRAQLPALHCTLGKRQTPFFVIGNGGHGPQRLKHPHHPAHTRSLCRPSRGLNARLVVPQQLRLHQLRLLPRRGHHHPAPHRILTALRRRHHQNPQRHRNRRPGHRYSHHLHPSRLSLCFSCCHSRRESASVVVVALAFLSVIPSEARNSSPRRAKRAPLLPLPLLLGTPRLAPGFASSQPNYLSPISSQTRPVNLRQHSKHRTLNNQTSFTPKIKSIFHPNHPLNWK